MSYPRIGIVSGMGAAAGSRLLSMLIQKCQWRGATLDRDFPEVFLHNIPSKGMDEKGVADEELVLSELRDSVLSLDENGVEVIVIACNTVHTYLKVLQRGVNAEIVSMVDATAFSVRNHDVVGVISSRSTKESQLYVKALELLDIAVIETTEAQQDAVDRMIGNAISGKTSGAERRELESMVTGMRGAGAGNVILACTELPLVGVPHFLYTDPYTSLIDTVLSL